MSSANPRKHLRVPSSSSQDSDKVRDHRRKRKRKINARHSQQLTQRAEETLSKTLDSATIERRATPPRPSISPSTPDKLTTLLNKIDTLIAADDLLSAYRTLQIIMRDENMQNDASRESLLRIVKLMQSLGDGKRQGIEQARIINAVRRREMETESEVKRLAGETLSLRMLRRDNGV